MVAERLFSLISEDSMSEQAKTSEEAQRASETERSYYVLPHATIYELRDLINCLSACVYL